MAPICYSVGRNLTVRKRGVYDVVEYERACVIIRTGHAFGFSNGFMISFRCSSCGKDYSLSDKFAGRKLVCVGCRTENVVLEATTITESSVAVDTDSAILAFVFEENRKKSVIPPPLPPPLPPSVPTTEKLKPKSNIFLWSVGLSVLGVIAGAGVCLALFVDWKGPDPRPEQAEELRRRSVQAKIQANEKESESGTVRLRAMESWNRTDKSLDAIVLTFGEIDDKNLDRKEIETRLAVQQSDESQSGPFERKKIEIQDSLTAAETRLIELRKQVSESLALAVSSEVDSVVAANDAKRLNLESQFYAKQEQDLRNEINNRPEIRVPKALESFDVEKNRIPLDESLTLVDDWTENFFRRFSFPDSVPDRFFAAFDCSQKFVGEKALRITSLTTQPITILFPEHRNACSDLSTAKHFRFLLRFPDAEDQIAIGTTLDAGKLREMRVRFGNSAGVVEFRTDSPRYCESLFFDGRGRFVPIEFPLAGDVFWKRTDNVDMANFQDPIDSLLTRSESPPDDSQSSGNIEPTFFSRIDWVEIRFFPRSDRTTFWIDGITTNEKPSREPYDLELAEKLQEDHRKREEERFKNRQPSLSIPKDLPKSKEPMVAVDTAPPQAAIKPDTEEAPFVFPGTDKERLARTVRWALQTAKGRLIVVSGDERLLLGSKSKIPTKIDAIEELDISGYRKLSEFDLNLICSLKDLKHLNLSRTDLADSATAKLAVLNSLESLNLSDNQLTFKALVALRNLSALTELNLSGMKAPLDGVESLSTLKSLRSLNLARSPLDSPDLVFLITLKELETLNLSGTKVGNRGVKFLEALTGLKTLDLSKTYISDTALTSLTSLENLQTLSLDGTSLGDACLEDLGKIKNLQKVSAQRTKITADGIRRTLGPQWNDRIRFSE